MGRSSQPLRNGPSDQRNPKWVRDEEILLLDLYFRRHPKSETDKGVVELSRLLRTLPIHPASRRSGTFRNPTGVFMKLGNLRHIDPGYSGKGLGRTNDVARRVWSEFAGDHDRVHQVAVAIRQALVKQTSVGGLVEEMDDEEFALEGRILFRMHRSRERNHRLARAKRAQVLRTEGRLVCTMCGLDALAFYGPTGESAIECHHILPLAQATSRRITRLQDLAVVCANCHRVLHRGSLTADIAERSVRLELKRPSEKDAGSI